HALHRPLRKSLPRLEARWYISFCQENESQNKALLKFAKLDFNILQKLHQMELSVLARWWKNLDFANNLPFARDRLVECYHWTVGVYFEPQYALARKFLTKVTPMASIIDDIYDVHGTTIELELFTKAVERWEISAIDTLPLYMKLCYQALLDVYGEMEEEMSKEGKTYRVHHAREAMKILVRAYFEESKWLNKGYMPTMEEYMKVALVSGGYQMLSITSLIGMEDNEREEDFEWLLSGPKILQAITVISRLMDDMVSHKQYGVSEEQACHELNKQVEDAWKDVNQACLNPTATSSSVLTRMVNLARVIDLVYKEDDCYTHSTKMKDYVTSLFVDSIEI
ncbi:hypothetical protein Ancab_029549, partial [Ancistrocladus abbreviatus]